VAGLFLGLVLAIDLLVPLVPPVWEAKLFADFGPAEFAEDPRQASASRLLERLLVHVPEAPFEYRLAVLEEEQPNALAFPGGLIVLTTGLLDGLESENELAMVVGHELGHYAGRDHLEGLGRGLALSLVIGIVSGAGDVAGLATLAADMALRGHSREEELRADAFGLELVHAEYGHIAGATAFFERLPEAQGGVSEFLAEYLSTHPMSSERIEALSDLGASRGWRLEGPLAELDSPGEQRGADASAPSIGAPQPAA
jgi:Zn-dependent protease with chaperone function